MSLMPLRRWAFLRKNVAEEYRDDCDQQKFLLNVAEAIHIQLNKNGLTSRQIEFVDECTFDSHRFHSYRRDGIKAGRIGHVLDCYSYIICLFFKRRSLSLRKTSSGVV